MIKSSLYTITAGMLLAAGSAPAAVVYVAGVTGTTVETSSNDANAFNGDASSTDLLNGLTPTSVSGWFNADRGPDKLVDGVVVGNVLGNTAQTLGSGNDAVAVFNLGTGTNGLGYDLSSIVSIAAWTSSGFDDQVWKLEVAGVSGSPVYSQVLSVDYQTASGGGATKVTITDLSGGLVSGVQYVRITGLNNPSGGSGRFVWQELDISGTATAIPEPSALLLVSLGLFPLLRRHRQAWC